MNWSEYIITDNEVLFGKHVVKGTRISVGRILSMFAQGWTEAEILRNYPRLTHESLRAVFAFAHDCLAQRLSIREDRPHQGTPA